MTRRRTVIRGFTLIELMVVVALAAVLLTLVAPSFNATLARKRLEGAANELASDLQYARSEAAQRNAAVGVAFGSNCYAIYVLGSSDATACASLGTGAIELKTVQVPGGIALSLNSPGSKAFVAFDPVRGMAVDASSGTTDLSGFVTATSSAGNWQARAIVTKVGRIKLCSPNSTLTTLSTDCN